VAKHKPVKPDNNNIFRFLRKNYDEALSLLVYARDHFSSNGAREKMLLSPQDQLIYTLAVSTVTTQLTSIMSWLMFCRAIENGEISPTKIDNKLFSIPEYSLGVQDSDSCFKILSKSTREILTKSFNIYQRIKRMEDSVKEHLLEA
jgi:hypothetical protein